MEPEGTTVRKVVNATRRVARHPSWLLETARSRFRAAADRRRQWALAEHAAFLCTVGEALEDAYGVTPAELELLRSRLRTPAVPPGAQWGGGTDLLTLVGCLVLRRRPSIVIETGVAMGFTTAVILDAMETNEAGVLHSIDLPPMQVDAASFIGQVVPGELRRRWKLHVGPSRRILPELARELAPLDMFVHDSDHSYAGQLADYHLAWPHLAPGACLVSDDVDNPAFTDFSRAVGVRPYLMAPPNHNAAVGLMVKPTEGGR
jgi:predicted O-methyltransferase YrrM